MKTVVPALCLLLTVDGARAASVECTLLQTSLVPFAVTQSVSMQVGAETRDPVELTAHYIRTSPTTMDGFIVSSDGKNYILATKMINGLVVETKASSASVHSCTYSPDVTLLPVGGALTYTANCDGAQTQVQRDAGRSEKLEVSGCDLDVLVYKSFLDVTPAPDKKGPAPARVERDVYYAPALQLVVMQKSDALSMVDGQETHTLVTTYIKHVELNPHKLEMKWK